MVSKTNALQTRSFELVTRSCFVRWGASVVRAYGTRGEVCTLCHVSTNGGGEEARRGAGRVRAGTRRGEADGGRHRPLGSG